MYNHLRAFIFDSAQRPNSIVNAIFNTWDQGHAVSVLPGNYPSSLLDEFIIKVDPTQVVSTSNVISERKLAIVETPDLAAVVLTSGTTAKPKPVELSFESMQNSVNALYEFTSLDTSDSWLCCLPPYYIAGLSIFARSYINESELVFHESFDIERIRADIKSVQAISLVPNQLLKLLDAKIDLTSLKTILVGGSSVHKNLLSRCEGLNIHLTYGMTETWGGICHDGAIFPNSYARIVQGEIEIKTSSLMSGYRHDFPLTQSRITSDGWFRTLDRGELVDNRLNVFGRADEIINSGGIKIDPHQLETTIVNLIPIDEFIVCSTQHEILGECVTLCVLSKDADLVDISKLRSDLKKDMPSTHLPLKIATIDKFIKNQNGKLNRKQISKFCNIVQEYESTK